MRTRPKSPSISPPLLIITVYSNSFLAYLFSQLWFPTVQEVLHADWQEVWHSPHPPFFTVFCKFFVFRVLICSITLSSLCNYILGIVYHISFHFKSFFLRQHSTQCSTACAHKKCCNCMSCTHIPAAFCHNRDSQQ